jgi:hypothetical protein
VASSHCSPVLAAGSHRYDNRGNRRNSFRCSCLRRSDQREHVNKGHAMRRATGLASELSFRCSLIWAYASPGWPTCALRVPFWHSNRGPCKLRGWPPLKPNLGENSPLCLSPQSLGPLPRNSEVRSISGVVVERCSQRAFVGLTARPKAHRSGPRLGRSVRRPVPELGIRAEDSSRRRSWARAELSSTRAGFDTVPERARRPA